MARELLDYSKRILSCLFVIILLSFKLCALHSSRLDSLIGFGVGPAQSMTQRIVESASPSASQLTGSPRNAFWGPL
jgi:hypothetical protein